MTIGTVTFFNAGKGFGFIAPEGGGMDVFVHPSDFAMNRHGTLVEGQRLSFDVEPGANGPQAVNLKAVAQGAASPRLG